MGTCSLPDICALSPWAYGHWASGVYIRQTTFAHGITIYWNQCHKCPISKTPARKPVPLQPIVTTRLWEMVAVEMLKVLPSLTGNQYVLVAQDYFSRWSFTFDQNASKIVQLLKDHVFAFLGHPSKSHSDHFKSRILSDLCSAFGVKKSHTTTLGDGLLERMNRSYLVYLKCLQIVEMIGKITYNYYCSFTEQLDTH